MGRDRRKGTVAGVDGCRGGWVVMLVPGGDFRAAKILVQQSFEEVLGVTGECAVVGIDMPIGLPEVGRRACDQAARAVLGPRKQSVFSIPSRAAIAERTYRKACLVSQRTSDPPMAVQVQAFNIFDKIRAVDGAMTPHRQTHIYECHPELAFWALNRHQAMSEPKRRGSRPFKPGIEARRRLLVQDAEYPRALLADKNIPRRNDNLSVAIDDVLDAAVCAWSAKRIYMGKGQCFPDRSLPGAPFVDARGLKMEIWC